MISRVAAVMADVNVIMLAVLAVVIDMVELIGPVVFNC
jgi:hypothetical protein